MQLDFKVLHLHKRFPLAISRGVRTGSDNLFLSLSDEGVSGWGEMSPGASEGAATPEDGRRVLIDFFDSAANGGSIHEIYARARRAEIAPCALAALDMALWDWQSKRAGMPLYRMLGLAKTTVPTSVTIGINPPDVVRERVPLLLKEGGFRSLKIKLGSPEGIDADQAMFLAAAEASKAFRVSLRVDANGGWGLRQARQMMDWLAERGVEYIEQPLPEGEEHSLPELYRHRAMPVFVDESCRFSTDVPRLASCVDGVNLKLMKCGGITEALRIVAVARACGLQTMIGCMGESSLAIAAGASLGALFDHIDLDSHLNLQPDPATGVLLQGGVVLPSDESGHGGRLIDA